MVGPGRSFGGGWGSGYEPDTTNQRMEINAAYQAVLSNDGPIHIVSDSTYVVNCFHDEWWKGWQKRNWKNSKGAPVANRDLWEPFIELVRARSVSFDWVKGHSGDPMNDIVDQLAVAAVEQRRARSGDRPPGSSDLGPSDSPGSGRASATRESSASTPTPAVRDEKDSQRSPLLGAWGFAQRSWQRARPGRSCGERWPRSWAPMRRCTTTWSC